MKSAMTTLTKIIVLLILVISQIAISQETNGTAHRQDLFIRAFKSLPFFSSMALSDPTFAKSLTPDELAMFQGAGAIATETRTINWLHENKVQRFPLGSDFIYAYTLKDDKVVQLKTTIDHPIQLRFSNDQSLFDLNPNEAIRTAMTETDMEKDIFVNLNRINDPNLQIDLPAAVSLLFHEFGHKLGDKKNQDAVNSVAAKLENFMRSSINTTEIGTKKVHTLIFKDFPFQVWVENIFWGIDRGPGKPREKQALTVVDGEATYAWVEENNRVTDLTDTLFKKIRQDVNVPYVNQDPFHFVAQSVLAGTGLSVTTDASGNLKFKVKGSFGKFILPFMKEGSVKPDQYRLYHKAFEKIQPWFETMKSFDLTVDTNNHLKSARPVQVAIPMPQYKIEFLDKKMKGNNLEIYYQIVGDRTVPFGHLVKPNPELWPEIDVLINSARVTLKATNFYPDNNEFKFVLKDFATLANSDVKVVGVHFRFNTENLATSESDVYVEGFLPKQTVLNAKRTDAKEAPPVLKSMQIWNGKQWVNLKSSNDAKKGSHLRFVLLANEPLRELRIDQHYNVAVTAKVWKTGQPEWDVHMITEPRQRPMIITDAQMRQTQRGNYLYVDFNIDSNLPTVFENESTPEMDDMFRQMTKVTIKPDPEVQTKIKFSAQPERKISLVTLVTQSGESQTIEFKNQIQFSKSQGSEQPQADSLQFRKMKCQALF